MKKTIELMEKDLGKDKNRDLLQCNQSVRMMIDNESV